MSLDKTKREGNIDRLELLQQRHRDLIWPAEPPLEFVTLASSVLGLLFDPYTNAAQTRTANAPAGHSVFVSDSDADGLEVEAGREERLNG